MNTFHKVLVAVDLDEPSANYVLESAKQLIPHVRLSVVHVLERGLFYNLGDASWAMIDELQDQTARQVDAYLQRLCAAHGVSEYHLLHGHTATMIQQHAYENDHDLIVLGTHGRHGIRRVLGSTANAVLRGTECNVMAVRVPGEGVEVPPPSDKYRHILAAVDLSNESHQVLDVAQILGEQEKAELHVVHVIKPFHHVYASISPATLSDVGIRLEDEAYEQARVELRRTALTRGLVPEAMHVRRGSPHLEIHDLIAELGAEMLVVGTHGKQGMELLLGSVANAVIYGIKCDVLAVRIR